MDNVLNDTEVVCLASLGRAIQLDLSCDINGTGLPSRTNRLHAVELMVKYLEIHDYVCVYDPDNFQ